MRREVAGNFHVHLNAPAIDEMISVRRQDYLRFLLLPADFVARFRGATPPNGKPTVRPIATPPLPAGARAGLALGAGLVRAPLRNLLRPVFGPWSLLQLTRRIPQAHRLGFLVRAITFAR
jgi:hypothetical protein